MDAVKFLKEKSRMCYSFSGAAISGCDNCPLTPCNVFEEKHPEQAVSIVEKWAKEHPVQTKADKFKEVFGITLPKDEEVIALSLSWWERPYEAPKEE